MKAVVYRQAALDQLADLIDFIAADKPGAASRVLEAVELCISRLATFPYSAAPMEGILNGELVGIRRATVTPYRAYVVFYFVREDGIEIVSFQRGEQNQKRLGSR